MKFQTPPAHLVPFGMRALKMVASTEGTISPSCENILRGAQKVLLKTQVDLTHLAPIEPSELATQLQDPGLRRQFVQAMLILSLADGPPSQKQMTLVDSFAKALEVDTPELHSLRLLAEKHMLLFRLDYFRQTHIFRVISRSLREQGIFRTIKSILSMRGAYEDKELAAKYRALGDLPEGTLGREFFNYIVQNGFSFPGEKKGFPEGGIYHDFGHVLTGYPTNPLGELQMASFQAGYMKDKPIFMLLFGVLTFSAGVNVTPLPQDHNVHIFEIPDAAEKALQAMDRGSRLNCDLSDHWNHWDYVHLPIAEVRRKINLS